MLVVNQQPRGLAGESGGSKRKRRGIAQPGADAEGRSEAEDCNGARGALSEVWGYRLCARGAEPLSHGEWRCGEGTSPLGWVTEDRRGRKLLRSGKCGERYWNSLFRKSAWLESGKIPELGSQEVFSRLFPQARGAHSRHLHSLG